MCITQQKIYKKVAQTRFDSKILNGKSINYRALNEEIIEEIIAKKTAKEKILYRLNFEDLITTVSTHLINLAIDEIDQGIQVALEWIGNFSSVDRNYVFLLD